MYSITCAPEAAPTTPSVAFSVVKFEVSGSGERLGVATNWLDAKMDSDNKKVPVYIKPSLKFGLPEDSAAPLIMIGPGTGVAPFRGFLQARRARMQQGHVLSEAMLFFGCRKPDEVLFCTEKIGTLHRGRNALPLRVRLQSRNLRESVRSTQAQRTRERYRTFNFGTVRTSWSAGDRRTHGQGRPRRPRRYRRRRGRMRRRGPQGRRGASHGFHKVRSIR